MACDSLNKIVVVLRMGMSNKSHCPIINPLPTHLQAFHAHQICVLMSLKWGMACLCMLLVAQDPMRCKHV